MYRHLPNSLTILRLVLAAVFFVVLNQYRYPNGPTWALWTAVAVFVLAALTDWLDGYLARKWDVETAFGRIMDPVCDKVLVIGAFLYLAAPPFVDPALVRADRFLTMVSGVYPWMVALMLARELLVTGIRGELEAKGVVFGANIWGKLKTVFQLVSIPLVIGIIVGDPQNHVWLAWTRDVIVYATIVVTVVSGLPYVTSAVRAVGRDEG